MQKKTFYTELAYVFGIIALALGVALMEAPNFGVSMIVAPAYLMHLKLVEIWPFFSFGMAEYTLQLVLVIIVCIVLRKAKLSFLFSFVTAVIYGFILDGFMLLMAYVPMVNMAVKLVTYIAGMLICSLGVALVFHTYIPPEAYELFVKELSKKFGVRIDLFKTCFDITMMLIGVVLSFSFFGMWHFEGVKLGTVICAFVNGWTIGRISSFLEAKFEFKDRLPLRKYF